jgi:hypothetical protein
MPKFSEEFLLHKPFKKFCGHFLSVPCPARLILRDFIALVILSEEYELWSSQIFETAIKNETNLTRY